MKTSFFHAADSPKQPHLRLRAVPYDGRSELIAREVTKVSPSFLAFPPKL